MKKILLILVLIFSEGFLYSEGVIYMGILPIEDEFTMIKRFTLFSGVISKSLGKQVSIKISKSYEAAIEDLLTGKVQIAFMSPFTFLKAREKSDKVIPILKPISDGSPFFVADIIASKSSGISNISDIKGKRIVLGNPLSVSSNIILKSFLVKSGIKSADLGGIINVKRESEVVKKVISGQADVGSCREYLALKNKDKVKIIAKSVKIPEYPICVNWNHIGKREVKKIMKAIIRIPKNDISIKKINKKYQKFIKASISDYKMLEKITAEAINF